MRVKDAIRIELARRVFWFYCQLIGGKDYSDDKEYLVDVCTQIQAKIETDRPEVLILNMPPRFYKSRTLQLLVSWLLGKDKQLKVITAAYNKTLATTGSKKIRDTIAKKKDSITEIVYSDVFDSKIKYGDAGMNMWGIEGGEETNYIATSPLATVTGYGADIFVLDDMIKSALEAYNADKLEAQWDWLLNTILSRFEGIGGNWKLIVGMTRWHDKDISGRLIAHFSKPEIQELGFDFTLITYKAETDEGEMLCESILNRQNYDLKKLSMSEAIFSANFNQEPINLKGVLYGTFKTYVWGEHPPFVRIVSYTDTADGDGKKNADNDYYAHVIGGVTRTKDIYALDMLYTKENADITEALHASRMIEYKVNYDHIESNAGGKAYSRNVKKLAQAMGNKKTVIKAFHQSANKYARIVSNATNVMNQFYVPEDWRTRWPEASKHLVEYQATGKNDHDDIEDSVTGLIEKVNETASMIGLNN